MTFIKKTLAIHYNQAVSFQFLTQSTETERNKCIHGNQERVSVFPWGDLSQAVDIFDTHVFPCITYINLFEY